MPIPASYIKNPNIMEHPRLHGNIAAFQDSPYWTTLGDLHGNVMLFLYIAAHRGAIEISPEDYHKIAKIYRNWEATQSEKNEFREILKNIKVSENAKFRLIGDELCDRGKGDDLTLGAVNMLTNKEVILSNHTYVFIDHYETAFKGATINGQLDIGKFKDLFIWTPLNLLRGEYAQSLVNLQESLNNGAITAEEIIQLYNNHKKHFKAFSYDYDLNGKIVIYSHAPISRQLIIDAANGMKTHFTEDEKKILMAVDLNLNRQDKDLIPIIDMINRVVQEKAENNDLNSIFIANKEASPLLYAIQHKDKPFNDGINNVHGHCIDQYDDRLTLDSYVGRSVPINTMDYALKYTNEHASDITYTTSHPWQQLAPTAEQLKNEIPMLEMYLPDEYKESRWVETGSIHLSPLNNDNNIASSLLYRADTHDYDDVKTFYGVNFWGLPTLRATIYGSIPFINTTINFFTFNWVTSRTAKILTFPIRIMGEAIKFPLMILTGALGTGLGVIATLFGDTRPFWLPIAVGFSEGIRGFAPNASSWINAKIIIDHLPKASTTERKNASDALEECWSSSYVIGLTLSLLFVTSIILASVLTGGGAGLGMIMPFVFGDLFGAPLALSPVLAPLSNAFGVTWPYIAGAMFTGGLTKFLSGVIDGAKSLFTSKVSPEPLIPKSSANGHGDSNHSGSNHQGNDNQLVFDNISSTSEPLILSNNVDNSAKLNNPNKIDMNIS